MIQKSNQILINLITTKTELEDLFKSFLLKTPQVVLPETSTIVEEELLTIKQLADFFQVSQTTIHNWKNAGLLPYIRIKSRIRFKKSVILELYEKRRIGCK